MIRDVGWGRWWLGTGNETVARFVGLHPQTTQKGGPTISYQVFSAQNLAIIIF
jgi:hypothetical protein